MIRRANLADLEAINKLITSYDLIPIQPEWINDQDLCLVAEDKNSIVGVLWCGLMAKASFGYVDYLTVDKKYNKTKLGKKLCLAMLKELKNKGSKVVLTCIKRDPYYFKSRNVTISTGMQEIPGKFTYFIGAVDSMYKGIL